MSELLVEAASIELRTLVHPSIRHGLKKSVSSRSCWSYLLQYDIAAYRVLNGDAAETTRMIPHSVVADKFQREQNKMAEKLHFHRPDGGCFLHIAIDIGRQGICCSVRPGHGGALVEKEEHGAATAETD